MGLCGSSLLILKEIHVAKCIPSTASPLTSQRFEKLRRTDRPPTQVTPRKSSAPPQRKRRVCPWGSAPSTTPPQRRRDDRRPTAESIFSMSTKKRGCRPSFGKIDRHIRRALRHRRRDDDSRPQRKLRQNRPRLRRQWRRLAQRLTLGSSGNCKYMCRATG